MNLSMKASTFCCWMLLSISSPAQDTVSGAELFKRFGADVDAAEINVEEVAPGLHVLFGVGGNVLASIGEQGSADRG